MATIEPKYDSDQDRIALAAKMSQPQVCVIGIGGAGCNIVSWIKRKGMVGGKLIAINTDANHLTITAADKRILIGEKTTHGTGAGGYPEKGVAALNENLDEVKKEILGANVIFVVAGLGGGTGTGASAALTESIKGTGPLIVGVVTVPWAIERVRMDTAKKGIQRLEKACDTVVVIDNNKLVKVAGDLPFQEALGVANELVGVFVKDITETITTASLINLDYADLRSIMERRGLAAIGSGLAKGKDRVEKAVKSALDGQLLDINDVTKAYGVLVHVSGGEDLTLEEVYHSGELVTRAVSPRARIVWGARVNHELKGDAHVFVCLTGVESAFLMQQQEMGPGRLSRLGRTIGNIGR